MKRNYLVDTDWVIHYLNGHAGIAKRLDELKEQGLALSVVALAELYEGVYYSSPGCHSEGRRPSSARGICLIRQPIAVERRIPRFARNDKGASAFAGKNACATSQPGHRP